MKKVLNIGSHFVVATGILLFLYACNRDSSKANQNAVADAVAVSVDSTAMAVFITEQEHDYPIKERHFEQVPAIAANADASVIYVAWYSGGLAPGPGNFVTVSVSVDAGQSWLNDRLIVYPKDKSKRIFDPGLWRDPSGQVNLFYASTKDSLLWDGYGGINRMKIVWNNGKISFEEPHRLTNGVMSNKPTMISGVEQVLIPFYIDPPPMELSENAEFPDNGAFIYSYSNDSNDSVSPYSHISIPEDLRIHDEPQIVQLDKENELIALVRTVKGVYFAKSKDYGKTWGEVAPFTAAGPTTSSRFYIGKLNSGNHILIMNASTTRNKMTAFLSKDGGETWPYRLLLDARDNVSYPDLDQTDDGNIHVVFDRDRTGEKEILYVRFKEDDIIQNRLESVFKIRVNRP